MKSILDIGLTLESLETLGVPVVGFGTDEFPSFYSRTSGHRSPMRVDTAEELAAMMQAKWDLGLAGGISIANPVPAEDEIPADEIGALHRPGAAPTARSAASTARTSRPSCSAASSSSPAARSLETNIALVRSNARLGAALALAYQRLA